MGQRPPSSRKLGLRPCFCATRRRRSVPLGLHGVAADQARKQPRDGRLRHNVARGELYRLSPLLVRYVGKAGGRLLLKILKNAMRVSGSEHFKEPEPGPREEVHLGSLSRYIWHHCKTRARRRAAASSVGTRMSKPDTVKFTWALLPEISGPS